MRKVKRRYSFGKKGLARAYPLQHFGQNLMAKIVIWSIPMLGSTGLAIIFGIKGTPHYYIVGMLATSLIFFKKPTTKFFLTILHIGIFVGLEGYNQYHSPLVPGNDSLELGWANAGVMLLSLSILILEFQRHNFRYESRISQLMVSVEEHSATLEQQKNQIEKQAQALLVSNQVLKKEAEEKEIAQLQ